MDWLVRIALLIAVAVIFPVMVGLGIEAFLPGPEVDYNLCYSTRPKIEQDAQGKTPEQLDADWQIEQKKQKDCVDALDAQKKPHEAKVFAITSIVGLIAIAGGALSLTSYAGPAGPGLVLGGMGTIMYGSARTFATVDKRWLFVVILLTLVGVIWVSRQWVRRTDAKVS